MSFDAHSNPLRNKLDLHNKKVYERQIRGYSILAVLSQSILMKTVSHFIDFHFF